jgi:phage gp36-like protein
VSYFADSDLTERLRGTNVTPTTAEVIAARAFAEGYINSTLTGRYSVPFSPVPDLIKFTSLDAAAYDVLSKHYSVEDPNVGDLIRQFWARTLDTLAKLGDGRMSLHDSVVVDEDQEKRVLASRDEDDTLFTTSAVEDW